MILAGFGSGAVLAALPESAQADAQAGQVGPNGESGLGLDDLLLYRGGLHGLGGPGELPGFVLDPGFLTLKTDASASHAPEIHFKGLSGEWVIGSDVANHGGGGKNFVPTARSYTGIDGRRKVEDIIYVIPGPQNGSCVGIGRTPPSGLYRTETGGRNGVGGLGIVMQPGDGNAIGIHDSNGTLRFRIGPDFSLEWRDRHGNVTARFSGEDPPGQEQASAPDHSDEIAELQRQVAELQAQLSDHKRRVRRRFERLLRRDRR